MTNQYFTFLFFFLLFNSLLYAQKDSIILINDDILVGEIKSMDKSVLVFKTPYSDSDFKIKWYKVKEIYSDRIFIISVLDGQRIFSSINTDTSDRSKVILHVGEQSFNENLEDIILLDPYGKSFFSRLVVAVDFGVSVTKANNLKQLNTNISASYKANKWSSNGYFKSVLSQQDGIEDIKRIDGNLSFQYFLKNDWFAQTTAIYLANNEQLLKLRSTYKGGMGYFFIHNNNMYFAASGGLAWTIENYTDNTPVKNSGEVYVGLGFNKYNIGDLSLLTSIALFPSITEKSRYRTDFNFDMKYDLPLDFYIKMSLTYNYDTKPIAGASNDDYVFTTSFGWEFN